MVNHLLLKTESNFCCGIPNFQKGRRNVKLEDLPEDVLCSILSKLPPKELSRTSVLSSNWRYMCSKCSAKLSFKFITGYYHDEYQRKQYIQEFIENVNAVLQEYDDKMVERFEIKIEFVDMLIDELNNWVTFAVQSRTKNLAFDLVPDILTGSNDRYMFPFHLLDEKSVSGLQCIQLSYISFKPPLGFKGFPSLRKLDLNLVHVNRENLEVMLHSCHNLQWLSLVRCYLDGKLQLILSHLRYLRIFQCKTTMVEVHTVKLDTFIFDGHFVPIILNTSHVENAHVWFFKAAFQDAVATLLNGIPNVRNLTLHVGLQRIEARWLLGNRHNFSNLRHLQLLMNLKAEDANKIPYAVSLIMAAPFIEKLEVHFGGSHHVWFSGKGYVAPHLEQHEYSYLKNMHITGYKGARGQLEFLKDVVEHAPALVSVTIETTQILYKDKIDDKIRDTWFEHVATAARSFLFGKISPNVELCIL